MNSRPDSTAATRMRRYRRRQREGAVVGQIELSRWAVENLILTGHLSAEDALDATKVARSAAKFLEGKNTP